MDAGRERLFTVGELARKGGVTVRTLQYYDACGLLSPSEYSEGGRRLYGRRDVIRLQQILFLKSMGFSLEEIRDQILPAESAAELAHLFEQQRHILAERIEHLRQTAGQLDRVIEEIRLGNEVEIDRLLLMTRAAGAGHPFAFMGRLMGKEQLAFIVQHLDEDAAAELGRSLRTFSDKLIALYRRNERPEGAEGQKLAEMWWNLMMSLTEGDPSLIPWMFAAVVEESRWPPGSEDLKEATLSFLRQAIFTYLQRHNMKLKSDS